MRKLIRSYLIAILMLGGVSVYGQSPVVIDGQIDLQQWRFESDGEVLLAGNWRFHWQELLGPELFESSPNNSSIFPVPSVWNDNYLQQQPLQGFGFATYQLRLLLAEPRPSLHLILPEINMAFKLWADNELIASSGTVGTSADTEIPRSMVTIAQLPAGDTINLTLQISNFYHMEGGIPRALEIDVSDRVISYEQQQLFINIFTIGALCIVGLHYLAMYLGRREETGYLWYSLLAFLFLLRVLAVSKLPYLFVEHAHIISTRLSYVSMFLLPTVYLMFMRSLFPNEISKWLSYSFLFVGVIGSLVTLVTPAHLFAESRDPYASLIQLMLVYTVVAVLWACYKQRQDAKLVLVLISVFAFTGINDTLLYQQVIQSTDLSQYGFLVFIFGHAIVLGKRTNRAYLNETVARKELSELANTLKLKVEERTADLSEKVGLLQEREFELAEAEEIAVQANLAKTKFLAGASHDLRQPLHAMALYTQMLEKSIDKGNSDLVITNIRTSLKNLDTLVEDIVEVSRLEAGVIEPAITTVSLQSCFDRLSKEFTVLVQEKKLQIRIVPSSIWVRSDPDMLFRILQNLLGNAVKYTDRGKVLMGCRRRSDDQVTIQVWDTGVGIPTEERDRIFNEFTQLDRNNSHSTGIGLGLSIAKGLADLMEHTLHITTSSKRGSCFSIELPSEHPSMPVLDEKTGTIDESLVEFNDLTVLLIDDDLQIQHAMTMLLNEWGCITFCAANQREALQVLAGLECAPDFLISDFHLKNETGGVVIDCLHRKIGHVIPAMIITANTQLISNFTVLHKPVDPIALRRTMVELLTEYANAS